MADMTARSSLRRLRSTLTMLLPILAATGCGSAGAVDDTGPINEIQVIGTHNSYHAGLTPGVAKLLQTAAPAVFDGLDYQHPDLAAQLSAGVRQVELDLYGDAKGGLYAHPKGPQLVAATGIPADPDPDPQGLMQKPGFKVMHVQDID